MPMSLQVASNRLSSLAMSKESTNPMRRLRSFVRREGRVTKRQQRAIDELWDNYVISPSSREALMSHFSDGLDTLEIGFGMGASLAEMAAQSPSRTFLGIEVHRPGVAALLADLEERGCDNVRIICGDAVDVIETLLPDNVLSRVLIFFPDPWHKKKHNKRRIVQIPFMEKLLSKLRHNGIVHLATDWVPYAEHMAEVMSTFDSLKRLDAKADPRPVTKFERRGVRLGHEVRDLVYQKHN